MAELALLLQANENMKSINKLSGLYSGEGDRNILALQTVWSSHSLSIKKNTTQSPGADTNTAELLWYVYSNK